MIAVCMIENGYHLRDAWKADMVFDGNPDGSIDRGICSINSIHGYDEQMLFIPEFNVAKAYEIWLSQGYEAWKDMPQEAIDYLKSLPEFDARIFKRVTGIDVEVKRTHTITVDGQEVEISHEKYIDLKESLRGDSNIL